MIVDEGSGGLWKLLTGTIEQAVYLGPHWPNASTDMDSSKFVQRCGNGCLYELRADPFETNDMAAARPDKAKTLLQKVEAYEATAFNPRRGGYDPAACAAATKYGNFWGPFLP